RIARGALGRRAREPRDVGSLLRRHGQGRADAGGGGGVSGALWATASGIGFGLFQALNAKAVRALDDPYVSTFLQLLVAAAVLLAASRAPEDPGAGGAAAACSVGAFARRGLVHLFVA